jgi:hypothetical protein
VVAGDLAQRLREHALGVQRAAAASSNSASSSVAGTRTMPPGAGRSVSRSEVPRRRTSAMRALVRLDRHRQREGGVRLRVEVDEAHALAARGQGAGQVDRRRGLAAAALLVREREVFIRNRRPAVLPERRRSVAGTRRTHDSLFPRRPQGCAAAAPHRPS